MCFVYGNYCKLIEHVRWLFTLYPSPLFQVSALLSCWGAHDNHLQVESDPVGKALGWLVWYDMLCCVMSCQAMLCCAVLNYARLCCATPCYVICHVMSCVFPSLPESLHARCLVDSALSSRIQTFLAIPSFVHRAVVSCAGVLLPPEWQYDNIIPWTPKTDKILRGNYLSSTTCLTQVFFKGGEYFCDLWWSLTRRNTHKTSEAALDK